MAATDGGEPSERKETVTYLRRLVVGIPLLRPGFDPRPCEGRTGAGFLRVLRFHTAAGRIRSIEKFNGLIGNRTRDLSACSIGPQPTTKTAIHLRINGLQASI
jgi:hypothetical protein